MYTYFMCKLKYELVQYYQYLRIYLKFDSRSRFLSNQSFSDQQISLFLIWLRCIFWPLQLNFKSFHTNLEAIHSLNGCLCTGGVIETNKSEALALVGGSVDEDFAADNISKGKEHLHQLCISKLLRQMINEKVASFWSTYGATYKRSVLYLIYSFNFSKNQKMAFSTLQFDCLTYTGIRNGWKCRCLQSCLTIVTCRKPRT